MVVLRSGKITGYLVGAIDSIKFSVESKVKIHEGGKQQTDVNIGGVSLLKSRRDGNFSMTWIIADGGVWKQSIRRDPSGVTEFITFEFQN